jgi:poly-gamma-glutamate capsule biosynthesis protein CapA/YwtB (metallophosphatase superfamily)
MNISQEKQVNNMRKLMMILMSLMLVACSTQTSAPEKEPEKKDEEKTKVSFIGVGDNLIHEMIYIQADKAAGSENDGTYDFTPMYEHVKKDVENADIAYIDQESIIGGDDLGISGYPTFNSPDQVARDVAATGFDLINTANNHCLDMYQAGIDHSSKIWSEQKGIVTAGTYTSNEDRNKIRVIERKGIKFSFLAYTYGTNGIEPPHEYSVAYFDEEQIKKDVAAAKKVSDVVIVSAHWGDENVSAPTDFQKKYAQLFADLGVDVVVGEHPHVIQPVNWVDGKDGNHTLVIYSLGNFLSGMLDVNNVLSGMIRFNFVKDNKSGKIQIEDVKWEPLITHYTGDAKDILNTRKDFTVYKLSDYTDELAAKHGLNGVDGQKVTIQDLYDRTSKIIKDIEIIK